MKQIAILKLGNEYYGLDIMRVNTIKEYEVPNKMPHAKPFVAGMINLRGHVVPILDLRKMLNYPDAPADIKKKIVILENDADLLGLIIDDVLSITSIEEDEIQDLAKVSVSDFADIIDSVAKYDDKLISILSIDKILKK